MFGAGRRSGRIREENRGGVRLSIVVVFGSRVGGDVPGRGIESPAARINNNRFSTVLQGIGGVAG